MTFIPSVQQSEIFDFIANGEGNGIVDAKAGSGKTTTIVHGMSYIQRAPHEVLPPDVCFLAFNKSIAETLAQRCPRGTTCSTFHSLGFRALKSSGLLDNRVKVDARKVWKLVWNVMDKEDPDQKNVVKLVGLLKSGHSNVEYEDINPSDLIEHHNIDFEDPVRSIHIALRVLKASDAQLDVIDFDDMLHLAVKLNARFQQRDWIFVDEAQDLSAIQHEIVARLFKRPQIVETTGFDQIESMEFASRSPTRLLAVGDPHQAIYGFRGADSDSMTVLAKRFSCKTLHLSVSYRCPKAVVREVQQYLR